MTDNTKTVLSEVAPIIGDIPVSVQIATALQGAASKTDVAALQEEVRLLRRDINKLITLVGDTPVSEQINTAITK